ncbi:MAG: Translation elongation factor P [Candidatus Gottesmanbacteria bacterium GW2011_GWC2_39_8]|uniref:Translation elongation factor P n=1 Tax=Candidatus Gottesmanbacteria bacterium GW2011_GWC2_39_8 TaxID=1618450 RepID=A0A0G0Q2J9_9BACT|nr:MAG: Translation elongation factor P [Candidatus Gottesmanbacteria bacterium GW2011_GWC2_39_8]
MDIAKIKEITRDTDGWLSDREGELLYELAQNCKGRGVIVEIGSWKGKSTIWLAKGSEKGAKSKIYAIDPHTGSPEHGKKVWTYDEFRANIKKAGVEKMVIPIVKNSLEAVSEFEEPVELLFIDGAHEYEAVKSDLKAWFPKVIDGGIIAFHDSAGWGRWPGVEKAVVEHVYKSDKFRNVKFVQSITFGQKVSENNFTERLKNRYTLLLKIIADFGDGLHLPVPVRRIGKKILLLLK